MKSLFTQRTLIAALMVSLISLIAVNDNAYAMGAEEARWYCRDRGHTIGSNGHFDCMQRNIGTNKTYDKPIPKNEYDTDSKSVQTQRQPLEKQLQIKDSTNNKSVNNGLTRLQAERKALEIQRQMRAEAETQRRNQATNQWLMEFGLQLMQGGTPSNNNHQRRAPITCFAQPNGVGGYIVNCD